MRTRTEAHFLQLFDSATLRGAIETATLRERASIGDSTLPVDIHAMARRKGFQVVEDLLEADCAEGQLLPFGSGFKVRLRKKSTGSRRRFSIAHEIGHTFFYENNGDGPRHVIGILSVPERQAEERICNEFASALLIPAKDLLSRLRELQAESPASAILWLQQASRDFDVSLPAMLVRMGRITADWPSYLFVLSRVKPNPKSQLDPKLRIAFSLGVGDCSNTRVWVGSPSIGINSASCLQLCQKWQSSIVQLAGGQYVLNGDILVRNGIPNEYLEKAMVISVQRRGIWKRESVSAVSASALFLWGDGTTQTSAYIFTVIRPLW